MARGWRTTVLPFVLVCAAALLAAPALAQEKAPAPDDEVGKVLRSIDWKVGPTKAQVGDQAEIEVPEGYVFTGGPGARKMLELMHNPTDGRELGLLTTQKMEWFLTFDFSDIGYIKDAEEEELDAEEILDSIKEGTEAANEERQKRGWNTIRIVGWQTAPFYDTATHNLQWCIEGESQGKKIVNYNTRILGREGVMSANLMINPAKLEASLPTVKKLLDGFSYTDGKRYAEYKPGDKIAKYGLAALVAGGGAVAAAKLGLFGKLAAMLGKLWKYLLLGLVAIGAGIKKLFTGGKAAPQTPVAREEDDDLDGASDEEPPRDGR